VGGLEYGFAHGYTHCMVLGRALTGMLSELGRDIDGALVFSRDMRNRATQ
jgi:hypothetical protein